MKVKFQSWVPRVRDSQRVGECSLCKWWALSQATQPKGGNGRWEHEKIHFLLLLPKILMPNLLETFWPLLSINANQPIASHGTTMCHPLCISPQFLLAHEHDRANNPRVNPSQPSGGGYHRRSATNLDQAIGFLLEKHKQPQNEIADLKVSSCFMNRNHCWMAPTRLVQKNMPSSKRPLQIWK
jgi:hypothetical protein